MVGNCICDDAVCCAASRMEILRRYYTACVERLRGKAGDEPVRKLELVMQQASVTPDICPAVSAALLKAETTGGPAGAMVLPDGRVVTGKTSDTLGAASALLLNALKAVGGIGDQFELISAQVLEPVCRLKTQYLGHKNPRLHTDEVLMALTISALTNPLAELAQQQLPKLRGCDAHFTVILSEVDEKTEADKIMKSIVEEYRKGVAQYGMQGTIVLTPTHYDKGTPTGYLCKNRVNVEIQAAVNPKTDGKPFYEVNHQTFMAGDRVIQRKNTEAVINGDLGTVQEILKDDDGVRVCILFDSKNEVLTYDSNDMKNVELAYAITVHSSQGCEFPCCIFPVSSSVLACILQPARSNLIPTTRTTNG